MMPRSNAIKQKALELGFDVAGITDASPIDTRHVEHLKRWLAAGCAAGMAYLHKNFDKRVNPSLLLDGAKSIICVGLNYKSDQTPEADNGVTIGKVASYACYQDYHLFIKEKLNALAAFITESIASDCKYKVCVDSVPLAERALAVRAGLGFIAKNHMLTHPIFGQQLLLGELITTLELTSDKELNNECSGCGQCLDACPMGAFLEDGMLDARRCISYLTIEHKDIISQGLTSKIGNRFFGCEECVLTCRRQKNAPAANGCFKFYNDMRSIDLRQIIEMDEKSFEKDFADSPLYRLGLDRLKRNAVICLQNGLKGGPQQ
jgi:epoxyqueuosine reductase